MDRIVVDRIDRQSGIARIEIGNESLDIKLESLPREAKEGDILAFHIANNANVKERVCNLESKLFK